MASLGSEILVVVVVVAALLPEACDVTVETQGKKVGQGQPMQEEEQEQAAPQQQQLRLVAFFSVFAAWNLLRRHLAPSAALAATRALPTSPCEYLAKGRSIPPLQHVI